MAPSGSNNAAGPPEVLFWRHGRDLVVTRLEEGALGFPARCVVCNSCDAPFRIRRTLKHAGLVAFTPLVSVTSHDQMVVAFSLCSRHRTRSLLGYALMLAGAVIAIVLPQLSSGYVLPLLAPVILLATLVAGTMLVRVIRLVDLDAHHGRLRVGPAFLVSLVSCEEDEG